MSDGANSVEGECGRRINVRWCRPSGPDVGDMVVNCLASRIPFLSIDVEVGTNTPGQIPDWPTKGQAQASISAASIQAL